MSLPQPTSTQLFAHYSRQELINYCKYLGYDDCERYAKPQLRKLAMDAYEIVANTLPSEPSAIKPLVKWVGGKTQILSTLTAQFPSKCNNYHEPFVGGGSVLLAVLLQIQAGHITVHGQLYAYDANESLIGLYINVQTNPSELYHCLQPIINNYRQCPTTTTTAADVNRSPETLEEAMESKESFYYWIRSRYNALPKESKNSCLGSAMFVFLNKTCFRGLYRVGPKGFNVPYGNYENPEILNEAHLYEIHHLIQPVVFECCDFSIALSRVTKDDFVYLDPPYAPETSTSFVKYTMDGFTLQQHETLFEALLSLKKDDTCKWMMSNADVALVRSKFDETRYDIQPLICKRSINAKNPQAKAKEVIIKNY